MGALHGLAARQPGELCHITDKAHPAHIGDESVAFRHEADLGAQLAQVTLNLFSEHAGRAGHRLIKAQQRVDQGGFAGAVWPQQADTTA